MNVARARLVANTLCGLVGGEVARAVGLSTVASGEERPDRQEQRARALRQALERLGPLYVKIGQMLSTRPDLCPQYLIDEFAKLHDNASPGKFCDFEPVLEEELGRTWRRYFREIDTDPVGTASLAQVYKVVLASGEPAVVKVQRPGVRKAMLDDMALLKTVVRQVAKRAPDLNDVMDIPAMAEVVFTAMRSELDFTHEADNMRDFRPLVEGYETLDVPEVKFVTPRVLVQSLAPGSSIRSIDPDSLSKSRREAIGRDLLSLMFRCFFVERVFHADPHPGNIFVEPSTGRATLIDFGMVGKIDRNISTSIALVVLNLGMNDGVSVGRSWIDMGRATRRADIPGFLSDMVGFVPPIAGASLENFNFGVQLTSILRYSAKRGIASSPMISLVGKAFANIEGSVRYLAPQLSITDVFRDEFRTIAQDLVRELLSEEFAARTMGQLVSAAMTAPDLIRTVLTDVANREVTVRVGEEMSHRSRREDRADARARRVRNLAIGLGAAAVWYDRRRRA